MTTRCEQAALDLTAYRDARKAMLTGYRVTDLTHGDKRTRFHDGITLADLNSEIRRLQMIVDGCNGCSRQRFIQMTPSDC